MRKLIIGFSLPKKSKFPLYSLLIRGLYRFTRGKDPGYSHVFFCWYSEKAECYTVYEASGRSVNFKGEKIAKERLKIVKAYEVEVEAKVFDKFIGFCIRNSGVDYGLLQAFGMGLCEILLYKFNKKVTNPFKKESMLTEVCSETVGLGLNVLGYELGIDQDLIGPVDIDNMLASCNCAKPVEFNL